MNDKYKELIKKVLPYVVILILILVLVIPKYSNSKLETGKDLGKVELLKEILIDGEMPIGYLYCPDIDWEGEEAELYKLIEPTISANESDPESMKMKEEEIKNQIETITKPTKKICAENDLTITTITTREYNEAEQQKGYNNALAFVDENFICQPRGVR